MILVASYNMRKAIGADRRRKPERTLEVLREIDADVIALQEADRRFGTRSSAIPPEMLAELSDYKAVPFDMRVGSIGWHGNAILVRKDVEIDGCQALFIPALEPRGAVVADLKVKGVPLRVVGMHLDLSGLWRRRQTRAIINHLDEQETRLPTVLMGDLNEWSVASGCLLDFAHHHYRCAPCGKSFHAKRPVAALDRIMVSDDLDVLDSGAHSSPMARKTSDHLPIWARLATG